MRNIPIVLSLLLCIQQALCGAETILHSTFDKTGKSIVNNLQSKGLGYFRGALPPGWQENFTGWNRSVCTTASHRDAGGGFLRFRVEKTVIRPPQFFAPLPELQVPATYRLTARMRNRAEGAPSLSLRLTGAPYTTFHACTLGRSGAWETVTSVFTLKEKPRSSTGLYLFADGTGNFDMRSITLEKLTTEEAQAAFAAQAAAGTARLRRPPADARNYLRNSRLPLGLQSGWLRHRDAFQGTIRADSALPGPSGAPSLQLSSLPGKQLGICSEPFNVPDPRRRSAFSFSYRGSGNYTASIISENRALASLKLPPSAEWKRVAIPFDAPADAWAMTLQVVGTGEINLDAFRTTSEHETAYAAAGECEVALALPESELSGSRIQFTDEPARLRYHVTGNFRGAELQLQAVNLYGERRRLQTVALDDDKRGGIADFGLFPEKPLGMFRVEAQVFRNRKPVSPPNELVITRLERPVHQGRDGHDSPFGIHVSGSVDSIRAVKAAGVNHARMHDAALNYIGWAFLEPEKGKWRFYDDEIAAFRDNHIRLFAELGTAPRWASFLSRTRTDGMPSPGYWGNYFLPLNQQDYANYVRTVVTRYRGVIDEYFVWNEPWLGSFFAVGYDRSHPGGFIRPENPHAAFAELCRTAFRAAKEADPNVRISGFNTSAGNCAWTQGVYDAGGFDWCDMVDFHFYTPRMTGFPDDECRTAVDTATGCIAARRGGKIGKPVYMSEGQGASFSVSGGGSSLRYAGMYRHTVPWENREDFTRLADNNVRYVVSLLGAGVKRVFLYSAHCYKDLASAPSFLVLFNADGYPHPMLAAHSAMARRLENTQFRRVRQLADGLYLWLFQGEGRSAAVISRRSTAAGGAVNTRLPSVKAADLYGNPLAFPLRPKDTVIYLETPENVDKLEHSITFTQGE